MDNPSLFNDSALAEALLDALVSSSQQSVEILSRLDFISIEIANMIHISERNITQIRERLARLEMILGIDGE